MPMAAQTFGAIVYLEDGGWSAPTPGAWVRSISQEHGVVHAEEATFATLVQQIEVGGLLGVIPIHSCLTADLLKRYLTFDGESMAMAPIPPPDDGQLNRKS